MQYRINPTPTSSYVIVYNILSLPKSYIALFPQYPPSSSQWLHSHFPPQELRVYPRSRHIICKYILAIQLVNTKLTSHGFVGQSQRSLQVTCSLGANEMFPLHEICRVSPNPCVCMCVCRVDTIISEIREIFGLRSLTFGDMFWWYNTIN